MYSCGPLSLQHEHSSNEIPIHRRDLNSRQSYIYTKEETSNKDAKSVEILNGNNVMIFISPEHRTTSE